MRTLSLAWIAAVAVAFSVVLAAQPVRAALPTPLPRPTSGGIKQTYCPQDGRVTLTAVVEGGKTSVRIGDNVTFVVTLTPVFCDLMNLDVGMPPPNGRQIGGSPLGGGLRGDGFRDYLLADPAGNPHSHTVVGTAVQAGTWTYTAQAVGYSFGNIDPGAGSGCSPNIEYGVGSGWSCPISIQTSVTIQISGPGSPTPTSGSGTSQSGSSGSSQGQLANGDAQTTPADSAVSSPPVTFGGIRAAGRASAVGPPLLIVLAALLVVAICGAGVLLIRRRLARRPRDGLEVTSGP